MVELSPVQGRMSHIPLPESVLKGFDLRSTPNLPPRLLPGGAGTTYLLPVANIVLKPAGDVVETELLCDILCRLNPKSSKFQISKPLRSIDGSFVYDGWSASTYIPDVRPLSKHHGEYTLDRFAEIIRTSEAFHAALQDVVLSNAEIYYLRHGCNHVWARAHRAVWSTETDPRVLLAPFAPRSVENIEHPYLKLVERLVRLADHLGSAPGLNMDLYHSSAQIVHGDIVGGDNILFPVQPDDDTIISPSISTSTPAMIDLSPTVAPASYAEGILLADGLIWCRIGLELVDLAGGPDDHRLDMLRRGLMFRCFSDIGLVELGNDAAKPDIVEIERVTGILEAFFENGTVSRSEVW